MYFLFILVVLAAVVCKISDAKSRKHITSVFIFEEDENMFSSNCQMVKHGFAIYFDDF